MPDDLLVYYERELSFLRQIGAEFAAKYPKIAGRLHLDGERTEDPHVERLIQAFAFLAARIRHKLDDDFPEITEALLNVLYPHYLAPIPSMSVVQFILDPDQAKLTGGYHIERHSMLYSQPVNGTACRFRTCYPVTLWPIEVSHARLESLNSLSGIPGNARSAIRLGLRCLGGTTFADLALDQLRFFLHGEGALSYALYELLFNDACEIQVFPREKGKTLSPIKLPPNRLRPAGFDPDEGMLPYSARSFLGYRLLQEYFSFPEKFLFVDLSGLERVGRAGAAESIEVLIFLTRFPQLEQPINEGTFRLGCAPVVNLFKQIAEPIRLSHAQTAYQVVPDFRRPNANEVYSVDAVTSISPNLQEPLHFQPFYSFRHSSNREQPKAFWYATRRPSSKKGDAGTDVDIALVDLNFRPMVPAVETLTVHTTCTNRDLPSRLPFGGQRGDLELEGAAPVARIRCLLKPTETVRLPLRRGLQWRLISHLSLNYLSICAEGREAFQEILQLYNFSDRAAIRNQIAGITELSSRRVVRRPSAMPWNGFCRGLEVSIKFDEEKYVGGGVFLLASVLDKFLGLYTSLNSFCQLVAYTQQREEPLKRWPPRSGERILL